MRCRNCGAENNNNARFCKNCGNNVFIDDNISQKTRNPVLIIGLILLVLFVTIGGSTAYIVFIDTSNVEVTTLTTKNSGNILDNSEIANNIPNTELSQEIIRQAEDGVPLYKIGNGDRPKTVIIAGVHGDQLNPSIAAMKILNYLNGRKIKGTVYIIPFASPEAISQNTKLTDGKNLNQAADEEGTVSYDIVQFAHDNQASAVGDFHETQIGKNPGETTIMCTKIPTIESYELANDMSQLSSDTKLTYLVAGIEYDGAIEDELNLQGTPAVTPLVQVPSHGKVYQSSVDESVTQMLALLYANGNLDSDDSYLKLANADLDGF